MKNIKLFMLASLLAVVLITGQPHAVVASPNSSSDLGLSGFDDSTSEFSVDINFVHDEVGAEESLEVQEDGTYWVASNATLPTVRVKADYSGMTTVTNATGHQINMTGKLYLIVNGEVNVAPASIVSSTGFDVPLVDSETSITLLYVGWGDGEEGGLFSEGDDGFEYAQDTVVVRLSDDMGDFSALPYDTVEVPVEVSAEDVAGDTDNDLNITGILTGSGRQPLYDPAADLDLKYRASGGTVTDISEGNYNNAIVSQYGTFTVEGEFNTTGFRGDQGNTSLTYEPTEGYMFAIGADGVELVDFETTGFIFNRETTGHANVSIASTTEKGKLASPFGVLALAEYGYLQGASHHFGLATADGFTDFLEVGVSAVLLSQSPTGFNVQTEDSPGFGAVVTLVTVGIIAYVAPRMRKD